MHGVQPHACSIRFPDRPLFSVGARAKARYDGLTNREVGMRGRDRNPGRGRPARASSTTESGRRASSRSASLNADAAHRQENSGRSRFFADRYGFPLRARIPDGGPSNRAGCLGGAMESRHADGQGGHKAQGRRGHQVRDGARPPYGTVFPWRSKLEGRTGAAFSSNRNGSSKALMKPKGQARA